MVATSVNVWATKSQISMGQPVKTLIIGKNGQLAQELINTLPEGVATSALGRADIDILNIDQLRQAITELQPSVVINTAAYTAVDLAESQREDAFKLNAEAPRLQAQVCKEANIRLIHISTDFVFDGEANTPYQVDAHTNPINVYGESKLAGEKAVRETHPAGSTIIRTSWLYSAYGNNFVKTMLRLMGERDTLSVVSDQIGCPTWARGLAWFIWQLSRQTSVNPLYHWADLGRSNWYEFSLAIYEQAQALGLLCKPVNIKAINTCDYPTAAARPEFSLLKVNPGNALSEKWEDNLHLALEQLSLADRGH